MTDLPNGPAIVLPAPVAADAVAQSSISAAVSATAPLVTIDKSVLTGILTATATGVLRIAGAAIAAHGFATQGQVDATIPAAAQEIVGAVLTIGGQLWAYAREKAKHTKIGAAAEVLPTQIVLK